MHRIFVIVTLFFSFLLPRSIGAQHVRIAWNANTEPHLAGYRLYYGEASNSYTNRINVGKRTVYEFERGQFEGRMFMALTAYDSTGMESLLSEEIIIDFPVLPSPFHLGAGYPNPANPVTHIPVTLTKSSEIELAIYDIRGRVVIVLHKGILPEGQSELIWNGKDSYYRDVPSGTYIYRLSAGQFAQTRKILIVR
jgi:hypothetical protein